MITLSKKSDRTEGRAHATPLSANSPIALETPFLLLTDPRFWSAWQEKQERDRGEDQTLRI